jgi:hypothetical protein
MDSPLSVLIVIFTVSIHLWDKTSRNLCPLRASTRSPINRGLYHWDFHPQAKNPSPLSSLSSAESRVNRRTLRAREEAAAPAWGHLVTGEPSELSYTDLKWRTKSTAAASLHRATWADEDHRVRPLWAIVLFSLRGPIEPWVVALDGETAGVPMVPRWWAAALPLPLLSRAYRFTWF